MFPCLLFNGCYVAAWRVWPRWASTRCTCPTLPGWQTTPSSSPPSPRHPVLTLCCTGPSSRRNTFTCSKMTFWFKKLKRPPRYYVHFLEDKTDLLYISTAAFILIWPPRYSGITTSCPVQNYDVSVQIYLVIATTKSYCLEQSWVQRTWERFTTYKKERFSAGSRAIVIICEQHVN